MNRVVVVTGVAFSIAALAGACGGSTESSGEASAKDSGASSSDGGDNEDGSAGNDGSVSSDASVVTVNDGGNTDVGTCV